LVTYAGAERVLEQLLTLYPDADLFSLIDFLGDDERDFIRQKHATTSVLQRMPFAKTRYRNYLPLMPLAIEQFDLSGYDLIISSNYAVAKGVLTGPDQLHLCYCHSPIRYAWDLQHQYLRETGLSGGAKGWLARYLLHRIRLWDHRSANGVDHFIANSAFIARRIDKVYRRGSTVIHPPVDVDKFSFHAEKENFYLTASRLVPYKRVDLIVEAFNLMPDKQLVVIGDGPEMRKVSGMAGPNVRLLGYQDFATLKHHMQRARAFVFAAEEDFGIVPVEAQACGTPVIAFGKGGTLETVRGLNDARPTGVFFDSQTPEALIAAIEEFERESSRIQPANCRESAMRFAPDRFLSEFSTFATEAFQAFQAEQHAVSREATRRVPKATESIAPAAAVEHEV
jgi:glycosyltransferase involved in cell wall biosynthesis